MKYRRITDWNAWLLELRASKCKDIVASELLDFVIKSLLQVGYLYGCDEVAAYNSDKNIIIEFTKKGILYMAPVSKKSLLKMKDGYKDKNKLCRKLQLQLTLAVLSNIPIFVRET